MRPLCRFLALLLPILFSLPASAQYVSTWDPDADGDNIIGVNDLLALLSVFEEADSDDDGIFDSQDDCVGTHDACGICNGSGVDADADGVCDDVDPCVGALDVCGVCNGPGPSVPVIDEIVMATDSVYLPPLQQWYVFSYAVDTLYTYVCPVQGCTDANAANFNPQAVIEDGSCSYGPAQCGGASTVTFDGHTYALVGIGTQCWFKENLRSDNYRNGDAIPGNLTDGQWTSTTSGAQTVYGEGTSTVYQGSSDEVANLASYGRLYNWYAVNDARGLCPVGFHVPTDNELTVLENALGGSSVAGTGLKSSAADSPPWDGSNSSGFSALPGGSRGGLNGVFYGLGFGYWWSSTPSGSFAWYRYLSAGDSGVTRSNGFYGVRDGFSVRCVRDEGVVCLDLDHDGVCAENEVSGCTDSTATNFNPLATEEDGSCSYVPAQCGGTSTVTFDGHTYALVDFGTQCWFKENLRSDNYRNGDAIPGDLTNSQWISTGSGAQAVYNNDPANLATYGRLYNWHAVNDARGLCPVGFHVPSDSEWMTLEAALGMTSAQANATGWRGTDQGAQLKSSSSDSPPWDGSNFSGFSALPGGSRYNDYGSIFDLGNYGVWWSSSNSGYGAWYRTLEAGNIRVRRASDEGRLGLSVRCVRDEEVVCLDPDSDGVCAENEVNGCTDSNATNFNPSATEDDGTCVLPGAQCGGASTVTFDGHTYALVGIGTQCWFKENLRSDNYRNGDAIPGDLTNSQWTSTGSGAQAVYNNDPANLATYGRLYNWYAVNDARGLCPVGFHVPTDNEWTVLENSLGGSSVAGTALKSTAADSPPWDGSNTSGFSALPGGARDYINGGFSVIGSIGLWWSSSPSGSYAWSRHLLSGNSNVGRNEDNVRDGFSVHCVRDEGGGCLDLDNDGVCAENEVSGCTDSNATNFNPSATEDDGTCVLPGPAQCGGASTVTFDGHTYALVGIGTQCWFKENLRSDNYRNGDAIPGDLTNNQWTSTGSGAQAVYNNDPANLSSYGRLYNWYAVNDARGLCPVGFHVPSDGEWTVLENALGGSFVAGTALKSTAADSPPWDGANSSGFSALPGGYRNYGGGNFSGIGNYGDWWSSSLSPISAWYRDLWSGDSGVYRLYENDRDGFSVRCVRDEGVVCLDPDSDGVCAENEVSGCIGSTATNFNPTATELDGSCSYGTAQCGGDSTVTFDGHTYALVAIGTQCWFKENLRSDNYRNGDAISGDLTASQWSTTESGAQAVFNNDPANLATYGRLYNWYAVNDARGLCPVGFHVPSDSEWMTLEMTLGMTSAQANGTGWRGTNQGTQLKATLNDSPPWNGSNSSGFSALPGGYRTNFNGHFFYLGEHGFWWSSTPNSSGAWTRYLGSSNSDVNRNSGPFGRGGFSVRCVRD